MSLAIVSSMAFFRSRATASRIFASRSSASGAGLSTGFGSSASGLRSLVSFGAAPSVGAGFSVSVFSVSGFSVFFVPLIVSPIRRGSQP